MCGRYDVITPVSKIAKMLQASVQVEKAAEFEPHTNAAPTQLLPIVQAGDERTLELARWGLVPFWAKDIKVGAKMFNARAESVEEKPAFSRLVKRQRCVIPADSFYEWQGEKGEKQAYSIKAEDGELLTFAGLYDTWQEPGGQKIKSYTIITTAANPDMAWLHDRMPLILAPAERKVWLDEAADPAELHQIIALRPHVALSFAKVEVPPVVKAKKKEAESGQLGLFDQGPLNSK